MQGRKRNAVRPRCSYLTSTTTSIKHLSKVSRKRKTKKVGVMDVWKRHYPSKSLSAPATVGRIHNQRPRAVGWWSLCEENLDSEALEKVVRLSHLPALNSAEGGFHLYLSFLSLSTYQFCTTVLVYWVNRLVSRWRSPCSDIAKAPGRCASALSRSDARPPAPNLAIRTCANSSRETPNVLVCLSSG